MLSKTSRVPAASTLRPPLSSRASAEAKDQPIPGGVESSVKRFGGLVLTRHQGESIMIGEEVEVQVVGLKSGTARIKIIAPRTVPVHRREVFDAIQANPTLPEDVPALPESASARPGKPQGGLVLTRSAQQSIMIGDEIEIVVVEARATIVKLKISAPRTVAVHRREVFDAIRNVQG
jgi:carbon storage regulator CsrA